jgi:hypothetical protein
LTVLDILIKNKHHSLARLAENRIKEKKKQQLGVLDELLADIDNNSKKPKKK